MNDHEKSWLSSRIYGDVWDLYQDCSHIHHDDFEKFEEAIKSGTESALKSLKVSE